MLIPLVYFSFKLWSCSDLVGSYLYFVTVFFIVILHSTLEFEEHIYEYYEYLVLWIYYEYYEYLWTLLQVITDLCFIFFFWAFNLFLYLKYIPLCPHFFFNFIFLVLFLYFVNELGESVTSPGLEVMAFCQPIFYVDSVCWWHWQAAWIWRENCLEGARACHPEAVLAGRLALQWAWTGGILVVPFHGFLVGELELGQVGKSLRDVALWLPWVPAEGDVGQGPGVCWCGPGRLARVPEHVPICAIKRWGTKMLSVPLTPKRVSAVPYPLDIYSRVSDWVSFTYSQYVFCTAVSLLCHMVGEP